MLRNDVIGRPNAEMPPCKHSISSESMTNLVDNQLNQRQEVLRCPFVMDNKKQCQAEWPYDLCKLVGLFTKEES